MDYNFLLNQVSSTGEARCVVSLKLLLHVRRSVSYVYGRIWRLGIGREMVCGEYEDSLRIIISQIWRWHLLMNSQ